MLFKIGLLLGLSFLSGVLGRLGGAAGFSKLYRRIGCSIVAVVAFCVVFGFQWGYWWVYLLTFGAHWGAFSTYYDRLYKDRDNFWLSGFLVGCALFPALFIDKGLWVFILIRAILLAISWGSLNRWLPERVLFWRRDVVEEFCRYSLSF